MKPSKINFVRIANHFGWYMCDIVYHSGRVCTMGVEDMPKTAREFVKNATRKVTQYDRLFRCDEIVYSYD